MAPAFQRLGVGRRLILETVDFCRRARYGRIYLWTFKGLDRARSLYESEGFQLTEEREIRQWGNRITEQMFLLDLNA